MRIDKFLKEARILKRRTVANSLIKNQRVIVNARVVKPAYEVKVDDQIKIIFGNRELEVRVLSTIPSKGKNDELMYEIIERVNHE